MAFDAYFIKLILFKKFEQVPCNLCARAVSAAAPVVSDIWAANAALLSRTMGSALASGRYAGIVIWHAVKSLSFQAASRASPERVNKKRHSGN